MHSLLTRRFRRHLAIWLIIGLAVALLPPSPRGGDREAAAAPGDTNDAPPPPSGPGRQARKPPAAPRDVPTYRHNKKLPAPPKDKRPNAVVKGLKEVRGLRSSTARVFRVPGHGIHVAQLFAGPANYQLPNGSWRRIKTRIVETDYGYRNKANSFTVHLPQSYNEDNPVRIETPEGSLNFVLAGSSSSSTRAGRESVTYRQALSHVDVEYRMAASGYAENLKLNTRQATNSFTFRISTDGLSLSQETPDTVVVSDAEGNELFMFPEPFAEDANRSRQTGEGEITEDVEQRLFDLGGGNYELRITVPEEWLYDEQREFPVVVDPALFKHIVASKDTFMKSGSSADRGSWEKMKLGSTDSDGWPRAMTYVKYNLSDIRGHGDVILLGQMYAYNEHSWGGGEKREVRLHKVIEKWTGSDTWPDRPSVESGAKAITWGCGANHGCAAWHKFRIRGLVQDWLDNKGNRGMRLWGPAPHPASWKSYYTQDETVSGDARPYMYVQINGRPTAPTMHADRSIGIAVGNTTDPVPSIRTTTPALSIKKASDANGDDVYLRFLVTSKKKSDGSPDFSVCLDGDSTTKCAYNSKWIEQQTSHVVPPGNLEDGKRYYWKVQSSDLYKTHGKGHRESKTKKFDVSLKKLGTDPRWAMWTHQLGNGVDLAVNRSNGNAVVDYPLDSLAVPGNTLDLSVTYNSQSKRDSGLSLGWHVDAGPGSDLDEMPIQLRQLDASGRPHAVQVTYRSGKREIFPQASTEIYRQPVAGGSLVRRHANGSGWTIRTASGSRYRFTNKEDGSGVAKLARAWPSTDTPEAEGFDYTYDLDWHLKSVEDPLGRSVQFTWAPVTTDTGDVQRLTAITTWDNRSWNLAYDDRAKLTSVADPDGDTVTFGYAGGPRLRSIRDGEAGSTGPATEISYAKKSGWPAHMVTGITLPGATTAWKLSYSGGFFGSFTATSTVEDPRGVATTGDADDYKQHVHFNNQGLPIEFVGPADAKGRWPVSRQYWDSRGNLLCQKGPKAVAKESDTASDRVKCIDPERDGHEFKPRHRSLTEYFYAQRAPYRLKKVLRPSAKAGDKRLLETLNYDESFQGLATELFANAQLSGVPAGRRLWNRVHQDWGLGGPAAVGKDDDFSVRWSGLIHNSNTSSKVFKFKLWAEDNARLVIGSKRLSGCWNTERSNYTYNCGKGVTKTKLKPGWTPITVEFQALGGEAQIGLRWQRPGSDIFEVVPASALKPNLGTTTSEATGTFVDGVSSPGSLSKLSHSYAGASDRESDLLKIRGLPAKSTLSGTRMTNESVSFTYDVFGRIETETDGTGKAIQHIYTNDAGTQSACEEKTIDRVGLEIQRDCNGAGDVVEERVYVGSQTRITRFSYDGVGRIEAIEHTDGAATDRGGTDFDYDKAGRLIREAVEVSGTEQRTATYEYYDNGWLKREVLPDPDTSDTQGPPDIEHVYDSVGNETKTIDQRDEVWLHSFDAWNRAKTDQDPLGNVWTYHYDVGGNQTKTVHPSGSTTTSSFDILGRATSETVGTSGSTKTTYNVRDLPLRVEDADGVYTEFRYDAAGRVTKEIAPVAADGTQRSRTYSYDSAGYLTQTTDYRGNTTTYSNDDMGRIKTVDLPVASFSSYGYSQAGELTSIDIRSSASATTSDYLWSVTYDPKGRLSSETDGNDNTTTYHYNRADDLVRTDDPRGLTLEYGYDGQGRRILRRATNDSTGTVTSEESYEYDRRGDMTAARNALEDVTATYDPAGQIDVVTAGATTTDFDYTNARVSSTTDAAGTTAYSYGSDDGRLISLTDPFTGQATKLTYTQAGRIATRSQPNGLTHTFTYDAAGRIESDSVSDGTSQIAAFTSDYDANSSVTAATRDVSGGVGNGTWSFTYDAADRLKSATDPQGTKTTYGYDGAGNRSKVTVGTESTTTDYDQASRPTSSSDGTTYSHNAVGGLTAITTAERSESYGYDAWQRLTQAQVDDGVTNNTYDYRHDALDRLIEKINETVADEKVVLEHAGLVEEMVTRTEHDTAGSTTTEYAYLGDVPLVLERPGGGIRFLEPNHHGDVAFLSDGSGALAGSKSYTPWGETAKLNGETTLFGFQSDPTDASTGLVDMQARHYAPELGRFTTTDPLRGEVNAPLTMNPYIYAWDNPMSLVDPMGLRPLSLDPQEQARLTKQFSETNRAASHARAVSQRRATDRRVKKIYAALSLKYIRLKPRPPAVAPRRAPLTRTEIVSLAFDIIGIVPVAGDAIDSVRCASHVLGSASGLDTTLMCGSAVPFAGVGATLGKWSRNAKRALDVADSAPVPRKRIKRVPNACSFDGTTGVLMGDGTTKRIEDVQRGEYVIAEDPETGERGRRKVTRVWRHKDKVFGLLIGGAVIATTADHPFWNESDREWQAAQDLDKGDLVRTADGELLEVGGNGLATARTTTAFNLTVNDIHTYFVEAGRDAVLVHNTCPIRPTRHSVNQKISREVSSANELDAYRNPLQVRDVVYDELGRPSQRYVGRRAEIVLNPQTNRIVSVNPTSSAKLNRLLRLDY